jgi:hypothetical protein
MTINSRIMTLSITQDLGYTKENNDVFIVVVTY